MDLKSNFAEKLSKILFLEIKKQKVYDIFHIKVDESIYLPIKSDMLLGEVKSGDNLDKIPMTFFVEGMFYVLGCDDKFKFNNIYKDILLNIPKSLDYIKGRIFDEVKKESYEDAYILLNGLSNIESTEDVYGKMILVLENLRRVNPLYKEEEVKILQQAKSIKGYNTPYLYDAIIKREDGKFQDALNLLNIYISMGGEQNTQIIELKDSLMDIVDLETGREFMDEDPVEALKKLIPLLDKFEEEPSIYYYVAIAYRNLKNHDKAIYYLNKALEIDNTFIDVVNELAINYASLGNYDIAISYLRKAFEVEKSIEICTNLIMCYINKGDLESAIKHINIAKKINPNDEILKEIEGNLRKYKN
ncbi:tetratricopeptide repeat protein [Clostridium niameyense]|uniref:Tetratricopeptide repeat protein n=1 Tax=Clostridium niameyense TaxID=1622073 RepID=A0A6M0REL4_9CLOT|nr:tetratricopeptide repeat protein [Clostridium niameyense]NEZ47918.1 tetratricopeptide repeat protein [Clostridium niameyense]